MFFTTIAKETIDSLHLQPYFYLVGYCYTRADIGLKCTAVGTRACYRNDICYRPYKFAVDALHIQPYTLQQELFCDTRL